MSNKILLFTRNGIIGHLILHELLPHILAMGLSPIIVNTGEPDTGGKVVCKDLKDIGFYETGLLKNIIFPFMDALPIAADSHLKVKSLKQISRLYKLEYFETGDFNQSYFVDFLRKRSDIIGGISFRILTIFRQDLLNLFEEKNWFLWNLHTGMLPKYRGVHIPFRALHNGEKQYGWTLHKIDAGIDTGKIIEVTKSPLDRQKSVFQIYLDHINQGTRCIINNLEKQILNNDIPSSEQDKLKQSYYSAPEEKDFQEYNAAGIRFLNSPRQILDAYLNGFAPHGCEWRDQLQKNIIQAITLYHNPPEASKVHSIFTKRKAA